MKKVITLLRNKTFCYVVALIGSVGVVLTLGWVLASISSPGPDSSDDGRLVDAEPLPVRLQSGPLNLPPAEAVSNRQTPAIPDPLAEEQTSGEPDEAIDEGDAEQGPPPPQAGHVELASQVIDDAAAASDHATANLAETGQTFPAPPQDVSVEPASDQPETVTLAAPARVLKSPLVDGSLPPIVHQGATDSLRRDYPRLEAVWVLDRDPAKEGKPQTQMVCVFGPSADPDRPHFFDRLSNQESLLFDAIIAEYQSDQLILAGTPERNQMAIWSEHRSWVVKQSGLASEESSRLVWGWYRHRSEAVLLAPMVEAYRAAVENGAIRPDSTRTDILKVTWSVNQQGAPFVAESRFISGGDGHRATTFYSDHCGH